MKSIFKQSAIGLVIFGMAGSSLALGWLPKTTGVFGGAEGLYLRPQNGDLDFVTSGFSPAFTLAPSSPSIVTQNISPDYQWGWRLYAGLKYTGNDDMTISWQHFNQTFSNSILSDTAVNLSRLLPGLLWESVGSKVDFDLDEAYIVWGHTITFKNPWYLRLAAGVEFANLFSDQTNIGADSAFLDPIAAYKTKSHMEGWGPRFELDVGYHLPCNFQWFARTNVVLLSATRKTQLTVKETPANISLLQIDYSYDNRKTIVPKFGMKIGLGWDYAFGQAGAEGCCGTFAAVELGWQADVYVHAIERVNDGAMIGFGEDQPFRFYLPSSDNHTVSNFSEQGLFVGIKIGTDWLN